MPFFAALCSRLVFCIAAPFLFLHPKLRQGRRRRLGWYRPGEMPAKRGRRLWVHGASAGDILALLPTVRALRAASPDLEVVASTITNSGHAMASRYHALFTAITYAPFDLPGAVRRTLRHVQADLLVLEYTELWPNLIFAAQRQGMPMVLHNGRLSSRNLHRYRWLFNLVGNLLTPLSLLLMRDPYEAERALALGAPQEKIWVTGNTKFDNLSKVPDSARVAQLHKVLGEAPGPLWVAGSTHEGEEEALLKIFVTLRAEHPLLRLVLAPRYVERAERLSGLCHKHGVRSRLRSATPDTRPFDVLILDTIGELPACYAWATLVFVGGSFVPRGGQNILEPAACGKPVLFGPHMHNFADSVQVLLGRGGVQVQSHAQLLRVMRDLLTRHAYRQELGETARLQVTQVRGAAGRNAELIGDLLATRSASA